MKFINGISEIIDNYDNCIIDLWGVLHDGHDPYPGAINALKKLKENGKKIVLLSNAPRRASKAEAVLENLGFTKDMYDALITSGEVTYEYVQQNYKPGSSYYYIGPEKDRDILNGLEFKEVDSVAHADFALATGFEGFGSVFAEKKHQLDMCLKSKLHLIVANPDKKVVKQTGEEQICAGVMGDYYTEQGGQVTLIGKPYHNAYKKCLEFFGVNPISKMECKRILCIGDSLHTDIAGGNGINADTLFIAGGIHKKELYDKGRIKEDVLRRMIHDPKEKPEYFTNEFIW